MQRALPPPQASIVSKELEIILQWLFIWAICEVVNESW